MNVIPKRVDGLLVKEETDGNILLFLPEKDDEIYFSLDSYAAQAFRLIDGKRTDIEICDEILKLESSLPEESFLKDVLQLFRSLSDEQLIAYQ